jgi:proteasome lid subunit RPN8/RPN11
MTLKIKNKDLRNIIMHCDKELPLEACGILIGNRDNDDKIVQRIYKTVNVLKSSTRFKINPGEQLKIFMEADRSGMDILGFYHSHPYFGAKASRIDISSANYPDCVYLIYSNCDSEFKCYLWTGEKFELENIKEI